MTRGKRTDLTRVELRVSTAGTVTVAVNGVPFEGGYWDPPWRREDFPRILDLVADQYPVPLAIHVVESDGGRFEDIVTPPAKRTFDGLASPAGRRRGRELHGRRRARQSDRSPASRQPIECDGFTPGEAVAITRIAAHVAAGPDGRVITTPPDDDGTAGEVLLFGRVSGTIRVLPAPGTDR